MGCAVVLLGDMEAWQWSDMLGCFTYSKLMDGFRTQPTDVVVLALSRLVVGPLLIYLTSIPPWGRLAATTQQLSSNT